MNLCFLCQMVEDTGYYSFPETTHAFVLPFFQANCRSNWLVILVGSFLEAVSPT